MNIAQPAATRRRRWPYVLLALVVLLVIAAALTWRFRISVAEMAAEQSLRFMGLDGIAFDIAEVEADRVRLENLRIGDNGPRAEAATLTFSPGGLMNGELRALRLVQPSMTIIEDADGAMSIAGMPNFGGNSETASTTEGNRTGAETFPALPDLDKLEIIDGTIRLETAALNASGTFEALATRTGPDAFKVQLNSYLEDTDGRAIDISAPALALTYTPERLQAVGGTRLTVEEPSLKLTAKLGLWLDHTMTPAGVSDTVSIITNTDATADGSTAVQDIRGRIITKLRPGRPPSIQADVQLSGVEARAVEADIVTIAGEFSHGAVSLSVDGVGSFGFIGLTADMAQDRRFVAMGAKGDINAALAAMFLPDLKAEGQALFNMDMNVPITPLMTGAALNQVISESGGRAEIKFAIPKLSYGDLIQDGGARGQIDLALAGTGATLTSPGLIVSGVQLSPDILAGLPPDIRRAFRDAAFLRMGGPGLNGTAITVSQDPTGGFAATGKLGLGLSNPKIALFLEGDAAMLLTAAGRVQELDSQEMTLRLVDGAFGPAVVSGRVELRDVKGSGETLSADAKLSLKARGKVGGYAVKSADIDVSGPLNLTPERATIAPRPGGRIQVRGFSGPLLTFLHPVRLTLTKARQRRIIYDRIKNRLDLSLSFAGFKTRALLNSEDTNTPFTLALGSASAAISPAGVDMALLDASGVLPAYDLAVENVDARVRLGASAPQNGSLTVGRIRHTGAEPAFAPLSLKVGLKGHGEVIKFSGALKAAAEKATLAIEGSHHLGTGAGDARFQLGPVVFAPGVVQPQDFAPPLYRLLLETIGQVSSSARVAWGPEGMRHHTGAATLSIDKLRTGEATVEQAEAKIEFSSLFPPRTTGPQRIRIGRLDVGVPLTHGILLLDVKSPKQVDVDIERFELFGGLISSQKLSIDPTAQEFEAVLKVTDIDLASILAFAEFGELSATGTLEGVIPISYRNGELTVHDGLLRTGAKGGVLKYKPRALDKALEDANEGTGLAVKALSNFAYDEISIRINEIEAEDLRLDIKISGKSVELYGGLPFEFNIKVEGPIRQIIQENLAPPQLPPDVEDLIERSRRQ